MVIKSNLLRQIVLIFAFFSASLSGQISSLQATQMTQEAAIRDLDNERSRLKDKVLRMEEEREALQNQSQALDERHKQQIQSLEKVCVCVFLFSMQVALEVTVL